MYEVITLGTPLARHREPWETIGKSKEALDVAQWERMQTGRLSEHFGAISDYVRRGEGAAYTTGLHATGARQPRRAPLLQTASALREDSSALVLPALSAARACASKAAASPMSHI